MQPMAKFLSKSPAHTTGAGVFEAAAPGPLGKAQQKSEPGLWQWGRGGATPY